MLQFYFGEYVSSQQSIDMYHAYTDEAVYKPDVEVKRRWLKPTSDLTSTIS
ncbi:MAG: hypothetical protein Kow00117_09300 [Phototrophicales bacterium]